MPTPIEKPHYKQSQPNQNKKKFWKSIQALLSTYRQAPALVSIDRCQNLCLSFAQERLWLLSQLGTDTAVYNLPFAFWLKGSLDIRALEKSLQEIVQRHEILRTSFPAVKFQAQPIIASNKQFKLPIIDLQKYKSDEQKAQYEIIIQQESQRPFDLSKGPLWRFQLVQLTAEKYIFLMTIHHIIYDGWSHSVFIKELSTLYTDFSAGKSSSLPDLPIQYADFAYWQRQWLTGEVLAKQKSYWKQQLAGNLSNLQLPYDYPQALNSTSISYTGKRYSVELSASLAASLQGISDRQGVTLFVLLLAAFNLLLYQYTSQTDIIICSTQAGRNLSKIQGLIGFFNNIVPIRTDLSGNPNFLDLIDRVHQVVLDGYRYQDMPLQLLTEAQNLAHKRLYQVMLVLQNTPEESLPLPGIDVKAEFLDNGTANFDLFLSLIASHSEGKPLVGYIEYRTDLFTEATINEIFNQFETLLWSLVDNPEQHLADLPLLASSDRQNQFIKNTTIKNPTAPLVAPRNYTEKTLAKIWAEVLGRDEVSIYDNFFAIGGHSLLATQVISRVSKAFDTELPILRIFESPTIAALAKSIESFLQDESAKTAIKITPTSRVNKLPLSFAQQRLWFLSQIGSSVAYNLPMALEFKGALNITALHQSLQEIVRRHESLRTTFASDDGIPYQMIRPQASIDLPVVDLSFWHLEAQKKEVTRLAAAEATKPFDLSCDLMLRGTLLCLESEPDYILLITLHHIAADGWSITVLIEELIALYSAFSQNQPSPLPDLSIQYADFAMWQRHYLQGEVLARQLNFWKKHLANAPELLQLPTDYPRPSQERFQGDAVPVAITAELTVQLQQLSQSKGTTLYMTLLAAWQILISRYSGQSDVVVGSPIANRNRQEIEPLIGFFVNTLAMRTDLSEIDGKPPSFLQVLAQVKATAQSAYDHQDIPFEQLVGELQLQRNLNYHPLVQVFFVWQHIQYEVRSLRGCTVTPMELDTYTTRADLELHLWQEAEGLCGRLIYRTDLFAKATIERMLHHWQTLLAGIVAHPECPISKLPILTKAERHQLLVDWNDTTTVDRQDKLIHQLFEAQVEKNNNAVAVVSATERLTYQELNQRANQLAHYLQHLGVKPDTLVGICVERSLSMVIGMLGVLKAGGAYVPLDPAYPKQRLNYMLSATHVPILLTQQQFASQLTAPNTKVICLDDLSGIDEFSNQNPISLATANSLAYVLYTSGSTGLPKAVAIEHHSPVALIDWAKSVYSLEELQGVLAATSICFDLSIFELFVPLSVGGTVIMAENALHLPTLPASQEITLINTVPSAIAQLLKINAIPQNVRTVNLAGEPFPNSLAQQLYRKGIGRVFNLYGPSEDTTYSTYGLVERDSNTAPTIGRSLNNKTAYVLDSHCQLVPVGIPGELYLGGVGLARGYINQPELTKEKFIQDPFNKQLGARLYKTGDLVRHLPDGNLAFLGRIDRQVKIRGFRIELGEIEAVLEQHPIVEKAVVMAAKDENANSELVAYLAPMKDEQIRAIREYLRGKLPGYMVPSAFVALEKFPLTPNGKVDRKALPAAISAQTAVGFTSPSNHIEKQIAAVWGQVLNHQKFGIHDSFFEVKGNSLLVVQVHHKLAAEYPTLKIIDLFAYPTIHSLANYLQQQISGSSTEAVNRETSQTRGAKRRQRQTMHKSRKPRGVNYE